MPDMTIPRGFRALKPDEITELGKNMNKREEWLKLREVVLSYYGPKAVVVEIETDSEYNDEGGYDDRISGIDIQDANGEMCEIDRTFPWITAKLQQKTGQYEYDWKRLRPRVMAFLSDELPFTEQFIGELIDYADEKARDQIRELLPTVEATYDFRKEPPVFHEVVLVPISDEKRA